MQISDTTARTYVAFLADAFAVRLLRPLKQEKLAKRQVLRAKIYIRDCGLYHAMMGFETRAQLVERPDVAGASWEGLVIEQVIAQLGAAPAECFHWRTHAGPHLDLLIKKGAQRWGVEVQYTQRPLITRAMQGALRYLKLDRLHVVYAGSRSLDLDDKVPLSRDDATGLEGGAAFFFEPELRFPTR